MSPLTNPGEAIHFSLGPNARVDAAVELDGETLVCRVWATGIDLANVSPVIIAKIDDWFGGRK
jgi:hypothetical protein